MGTLSRGGQQNLDPFHDSIISEVIDLIYPVGTIYVTTRSDNPSSFLKGTTWEKIGDGRVLMGADDAHAVGSTVDSGLPDIQGTHKIGWGDLTGGGAIIPSNSTTGAFYSARDGTAIFGKGTYESTNDNHRNQVGFKASNYNAIYGRSSIVQPPAFFCYFWKRLS